MFFFRIIYFATSYLIIPPNPILLPVHNLNNMLLKIYTSASITKKRQTHRHSDIHSPNTVAWPPVSDFKMNNDFFQLFT